MENELKVAMLQVKLAWENSSENLKAFDEWFEKLNPIPHLVVLPEMFNTGFTMHAEKVAQKMDEEGVKWMKEKSQKFGIGICGSMVIQENGQYYNRLVWTEHGEIRGTYDKRHLFRMADEHLTFSGGKELLKIEFKGWKIMPLICYDLRFPVWSRTNNMDLQLFVANWPAPRVDAWDKLLMARAIENQCYVIGVNRIGVDGKNIPYSGHSIAISPKGQPITKLDNSDEGWIYTTLNKQDLTAFREKFPVGEDADRYSIEI